MNSKVSLFTKNLEFKFVVAVVMPALLARHARKEKDHGIQTVSHYIAPPSVTRVHTVVDFPRPE